MSSMKEAVSSSYVGFALFFFSVQCHANAPAAAPQSVPPASLVSFGSMLQVLLGLGLVLGAIAGTAWLLRRFSPGQIGAGGAVKVVGGVAVGPKERVVLIEIGETWLVLGVAPGQVNTLHTLARPAGGTFFPDAASKSKEDGFSVWLKQAMQGRKNG